ncbi:MarR family winged helix-turn-helix transcriptional regulator [Streptomyces sp. NBC_00525]|uniref:MarR family winged helix-turn-helix transcriptional regulator n=1 Tax=Streptomyces sp. NBC_00525 TaxID=2903660 RepID=UPI002E80037C|nr:MarR family winged helix-turn-helix transcriptional regulator [Streptomyces sp. NBC_00525]WUC97438.1 MarR family transcriptional regulator [Streptomyces sp. NBC_00525]
MRTTDEGPDRGTDGGPTGLQSFAVLLRRMNSEFNRITHEFAQSQGLHPTDVQALVAILDGVPGEEGGAMTPGRLREQLDLTSGAVTACLDRLERAGHIRRVRDSSDRRVVHLHYAAPAKHVARDFFRPLAAGTEAARRRFDENELRVVVRFLETMNDELGQLRRTEPRP